MRKELEISNQILDVFQGFRMAPTPIDKYEEVGKEVLRNKIIPFVMAGKTIDFVMLGFPFKSTNVRDKVLGTLPDFGEEVTLQNFSRFNDLIKQVYQPGVSITMASDGYAFNDILGVEEKTVEEYQEISTAMGKSFSAPMNWFNLKTAYSGTSLSNMREKLNSQFGVTWEELERRILMDADVNYLYRGMIRFMEEELANKDYPSRNQLNKAAKILTRQMMLSNEAYSKLVSHEFSNHIRLSMHPSINAGAKYSFQLIPSPKAHHSPWHCAILDNNGQLETIHRKDAEAAGYELVNRDGRPYKFVN